MEELRPEAFFELDGLECAALFQGLDRVWLALDRIKDYVTSEMKPNVADIRRHGETLRQNVVLWGETLLTEGFELKPGDAAKGLFEVWREGQRLEGASVLYAGASLMDDRIQIGPGVVVEPGALIKGPTIIGARTEVRQGAYIRGSCLVGRACIVGHVTEMKNAVMLDGAKAGHFAYLGDSILGRDVNLGAGTKLANLKIVPGPMRIRVGDRTLEADRRKFGAILGDGVETGCNSVTSPGTLMAPRCLVAPNMTVPAGYYKRRTIVRPG
ncbi:MAG: glucose-1-phosphate thymidylyltransferase [Proteobacteria bacterium]|nr:glucose-1-phosphate thymidylyltransferase [Pseudomonadota bacterium]